MNKKTKIIGVVSLIGGLLFATGCSLGGGASSDKFYTITFVQDGCDSITRTVKEGDALTDIPTPQPKKGYTVAWETADFSSITSNLTIEANATANEYIITYQIAEAEGETMEGALTQTVTYDAPYELATPAKQNYDFLGWKANDELIAQTGTWNIDSNVTLTPTWKSAVYTIVFVQTDGTEVVRLVNIGETIATEDIPAPIEEAGYDVEWSVSDFSTITGNTTVTVKKTAKTFTATYNLAAGESMADSTADTFTYNTAYELKVPTKEGYTFQNWKAADGKAIPSTGTWNYLTSLELTAEWTANDNTITFIYSDGTKVEKTIKTGETLEATDIPTLNPVEGFDVAWSVTDFSGITGSTTVNEVRTPKEYTITFKAPENPSVDGKTETVKFNSDYTLPTLERENYTFTGWEYNGAIVASTGKWNIASDVTLTASWVEDFYTVTFAYQGGKTETITVKKGGTLTQIPANTVETGYTFAWSVTDFSKIESNMVVQETKKANTYKITFDVNGGNMETKTVTVTYGESFDLTSYVPTRSGYKFVRWEESGKEFALTGVWSTDGNITLKATWKTVEDDSWTGNY